MLKLGVLQILKTSPPHSDTAAESKGNRKAGYKTVQREGAEAEAALKGASLAQNTYVRCRWG